MKLLTDIAPLPQIASVLRKSGYDAIHVRDIGLHAVHDELVFADAERNERVIVSADTDFGALFALASLYARHSSCSARLPKSDRL